MSTPESSRSPASPPQENRLVVHRVQIIRKINDVVEEMGSDAGPPMILLTALVRCCQGVVTFCDTEDGSVGLFVFHDETDETEVCDASGDTATDALENALGVLNIQASEVRWVL